MDPNFPRTDVPPPTTADEEIVDPSDKLGNKEVVNIRRHPIGLIIVYVEAILGLGLSSGLILFLLPSITNPSPDPFNPSQSSPAMSWAVLFIVVSSILMLIFLIAYTAIYNLNRWMVTDDGITQVLQKGLFNKYTAELSMANIEDVSAERKGILASIFNYGTLKVQTAGKQDEFNFIYCPEPDRYAKIVLDARERFINSSPETAKQANPLIETPRA